jgi:signal transduction histidine kinase
LERQLHQSEKLASIGLLAGGFAHEINNPIGGILVFSQMLLREIAKDSPHYQDVLEIEGAAKRCKAIVENLLDFARQRTAKPSESLSPTSIHEAVHVAKKFAELGHNRGGRCEVILNLSKESDIVLADKNKMIQIFLNLFSNALQAMPNGGNLIVETKQVKKSFVITVQDNGTGIESANIKKIFDPFFTTKPPGSGTGLGLSIVHGMISDLGGSISVTSRKGRGTRFVIELPQNAAHGEQQAS